jgi:hypothetical protein
VLFTIFSWKINLGTGWTLVLSYSVEEADEYLENFKLSEKRNPETVISNYQSYKQQKQQGFNNRPPTSKEKNQQLYDQAVKVTLLRLKFLHYLTSNYIKFSF